MKLRNGICAALSALLLTACGGGTASRAGGTLPQTEEPQKVQLVVFAAASLQETLTEIGDLYRADHPEVEFLMNFDSSGTLKTQIQEGAPCDLFLSAAPKQMDQLDLWFPELRDLIGVPQDPIYHPEGDVFEHTMLALDSAARLLSETKTTDAIDLRLTDGLIGFSRKDGDTVIIAGMGGETMISILKPADWVREDVLLILEPQSKQDLLRRWLADNGLCIKSERLVRDAGRIYPVLTARGGRSPDCSEVEFHTGRWELIRSDPLLLDYLTLLQKRAAQAAPYDPKAHELLAAFRSMEERWREHDDRKRDI